MASAKQVYRILDEVIPFENQESWDNSGLLLDSGKDSDKVLVCLDVTANAVSRAEKNGAGIIVSHHPLIFSPLKKLSEQDLVYRLIEKGISVVCAHTNFDKYEKGTGYCMAEALGLENIQFCEDGICLTGRLTEKDSISAVAKKCKDIFGAASCSLPDKKVKRVFICPGSGGGLTEEVLAGGADCFITGECSYHNVLDLRHRDVGVITLGHDLSEKISLPSLAGLISGRLPGLQVSVFMQKALTESV